MRGMVRGSVEEAAGECRRRVGLSRLADLGLQLKRLTIVLRWIRYGR